MVSSRLLREICMAYNEERRLKIMNKFGMNKWDIIGLTCTALSFILGGVGTIASIKSSNAHTIENAEKYNNLTGQTQTLKQ